MSERPYLMRDVPKTRDENGKYIRGSNSQYFKLSNEQDVRIVDGKFHSSKSRREAAEKHSATLKSQEEMEERRNERQTRGYKSFRFPFTSPILPRSNIVRLPDDVECKSITVEDVFLQSNNQVFRSSTDPLSAGTNMICFSEGIRIRDNRVRLSFGPTIMLPMNENVITEFTIESPVAKIDSNSFKIVNLHIPNHCVRLGTTVYLIDANSLKPNPLHYWPFVVESVEKDHLRCTPAKNGKQVVYIPEDFQASHLFIPPYTDMDDLCKVSYYRVCVTTQVINHALEGSHIVRWIENRYEVYNSDTKSTTEYQSIMKYEKDQFITSVSPKCYSNMKDLCEEIQRCMNPPIITPSCYKITIDGTEVALDYEEYSTTDFCSRISQKINTTLNWNDIQKIKITYDLNNGTFEISRASPFKLSFGQNSIKTLLGFSEDNLFGSSSYTSQHPVFYVSSIKCWHPQTNRYLTSYNQEEDAITIRAISKIDWMKFRIAGYSPTSSYASYVGHNFSIDFSFTKDSSATNYLGILKHSEKTFKSDTGVSSMLSPPSILYLVIPELEGTIVAAESLKENFQSCMAILYLEGNKRTYRSKTLFVNELVAERNVKSSSNPTLTLKFYTHQGVEYPITGCTGNISLKIVV